MAACDVQDALRRSVGEVQPKLYPQIPSTPTTNRPRASHNSRPYHRHCVHVNVEDCKAGDYPNLELDVPTGNQLISDVKPLPSKRTSNSCNKASDVSESCQRKSSKSKTSTKASGVSEASKRRSSKARTCSKATAGSEAFENWGTVIHPKDVQKLEQIGTGSMGNVYRGEWKNRVVAIKTVNVGLKMNFKRHVSFAREVKIMTTVSHDNLVAFCGVVHNPSSFDIVMEHCAGGDCFDLLQMNHSFSVSWQQVKKLCFDTALALNYLHTCNPQIIHRDLKSLNVLLRHPVCEGTTPWAKVSDFGLSKMKEEKAQEWGDKMTSVGTGAWMAPEMHSQHYDEKVDVYSYAMFMYEAICCEIPFGEYDPTGEDMLQACLEGARPDLNLVPHDCPPRMMKLMTECWRHKPCVRPSFREIVEILEALDDCGLQP